MIRPCPYDQKWRAVGPWGLWGPASGRDIPVDVRGTPQTARRWRITAASPELAPIDLWYSPQGEWLALESKVRGGRTLQYRIR